MSKRKKQCMTAKHKEKIQAILAERTEKLFVVGNSVNMSMHDTMHTFKIINETIHEPLLMIWAVSGDMVKVKATWLGSGIASHPTRTQWVNKSLIEPEYPWGLHKWYSFIDIFAKRPDEPESIYEKLTREMNESYDRLNAKLDEMQARSDNLSKESDKRRDELLGLT